MPGIDKRGKLQEIVCTYRSIIDGKVFLCWNGNHVKILKGKEAAWFLAQVDDLDDYQAQLLMAKATGNFKRGHER